MPCLEGGGVVADEDWVEGRWTSQKECPVGGEGLRPKHQAPLRRWLESSPCRHGHTNACV